MSIEKQIFNVENNNNLEGNYPLLLGEPLGFIDNINVTYPKIAELRDEMISNSWKWNEISMVNDQAHVEDPKLAAHTSILLKTLTFQMAGDAIASRSVQDILGLFCSNSELEGLLKYWARDEYVHGMTYTEIVRVAFRESNQVFEMIKQDEQVLRRARNIGKVFGQTYRLGLMYKLGMTLDQSELRQAILRYLVTLLGLESISFGSSFASTFAVVEASKKYNGICTNVELIARDEMVHARAGAAILTILLSQPEWRSDFNAIKPQLEDDVTTLLNLEFGWAQDMFAAGDRNVVGLNAKLLNEHTLSLLPLMQETTGLGMQYTVPKKTPLSFVETYLNMNSTQKAAQNVQLTNYKSNTILDDTAGEKFTF